MITLRRSTAKNINCILIVYLLLSPSDSIHVSIHYSKGNKGRPEVYISEEDKKFTVKDVTEVLAERPLHKPQRPQPKFPDDQIDSDMETEPQIAVPTDIEEYHMKKIMKRMHDKYQNQMENTKDRESIELENNKQDDHQPGHHRRYRKKNLKETFWSYKNLPPIKKNHRQSLETYDMKEVKANERLHDKLSPRHDAIEYKGRVIGDMNRSLHDTGETSNFITSSVRGRGNVFVVCVCMCVCSGYNF